MSSVCPSLDDDRISNLPLVLKHFILDRVPLHDAARTSILSKAWRITWTTKPVLAFDPLFCLEAISKKTEKACLSAFSDAVDMILAAHTGPIVEIEIFIPPELDKHHISQWIEHLSKQDVLVLKLDNSENDACLIPSHFFNFSKLKEFRLKKWILSPPNADGCFTNLNFQVKSSNPEDPNIERHLESLDWNDVVLDQLLTVEICDVVGFRAVHHLTKILLASSPSLREMSLFCSSTVSDPSEKLRIKRELLELPKKSVEAQVHWFD
ncbi:hypothetical protein AgCh_018699 [Apium graveolens]